MSVRGKTARTWIVDCTIQEQGYRAATEADFCGACSRLLTIEAAPENPFVVFRERKETVRIDDLHVCPECLRTREEVNIEVFPLHETWFDRALRAPVSERWMQSAILMKCDMTNSIMLYLGTTWRVQFAPGDPYWITISHRTSDDRWEVAEEFHGSPRDVANWLKDRRVVLGPEAKKRLAKVPDRSGVKRA